MTTPSLIKYNCAAKSNYLYSAASNGFVPYQNGIVKADKAHHRSIIVPLSLCYRFAVSVSAAPIFA